MTTTTNVSQVKLNVMTEAQYTSATKNTNELYMVTDAKIPASDISGLATVATSGSYNDLSNQPTIPTVNDATLTITQGGVSKGTFTANASSDVTIDLDAGGSADIDNQTITKNSDDKLQAVALIDQHSGFSPKKIWTGTRAQYDAIATKSSLTLYNITDDTDVTLTILEALYPVGSVYITTANTCPLTSLISGSTWTLVSTGIVKAGNIPCKGNGKTLGLTDGTSNKGLYQGVYTNGYALGIRGASYGENTGDSVGQVTEVFKANGASVGLTTDSTKSGIIADTSSLTLSVNIFERTA